MSDQSQLINDDKIKVIEVDADEEISLIEVGIPGPIGPQGTVTPEVIALKEAAEDAAKNAKESEINALESELNAKESELNAKKSELNAAESAEHTANDAALVYSYVNAPAYDPEKIYNYNNPNGISDVVSYIDGYAYRCIGDNIQGESPPTSLNWVRIPEVAGDLFVIVKEDDEYHITQSLTPGKKESDFFEKKSDGSITFKPIVIDGTESQRDFFPREPSKSRLGKNNHRWKGVYADEGYYEKLYSGLYNGYIPEDSANRGLPNGYASLDINGKIPLTQLSDSMLGNVNYQGTWNAATNTPNLTTVAPKGHYWITSVTGTQFSKQFDVGDWIVSNGVSYDKVDNTDAVATVAGRTGNVVLTKADVGLNNVDNTTDTNKPVSAAQKAYTDAHINNQSNPHNVTKSHIGLGNADNTSDINKPISTAVQKALSDMTAGIKNVTVENVLTSTVTTNALSAAQGKVLNDSKANLSGAAFAGALQVIGSSIYFYLASSATADTVNDLRIRNNAGVLSFEKCTVANATKGGGTWAATGASFTQVNSDGSISPVRQ